MRPTVDMLAQCWEERDLDALLAQRFGMFAMEELAEQLERKYDDVVRLTLGKSELPVHPDITEAMVAALRDPKRSSLVYPLGLPELREAVADYEGQAYGRHVDPDHVVISAGTSTLFRNLCCLLAHDGGEVLLPRPYYPLYLYSAALAGASVSFYDVDLITGCIDFASLRAALNGATRIVILNSPGNPLGNQLTMADLRQVDEAVDGRAVIISDELYRNIHFDEEPPSLGALSDPRSPAVVTNAFSKGFRMYARRVGYAVVPGEFTHPLATMQDHTLLTTDPVPQYGAIEALRHPDEVDALRTLYAGRRDYAVKRLGEVRSVRPIRAEGSFYLTVDVGSYLGEHESDRSLAEAILTATHVATVPGSDFGLPGTLRLTYSASQFDDAIDRLARYFEERP
ncbi:MAG TPA: aminotransferase class I/II-fold pyridoxal phosphate-dependent enzyme [Streptosporangiaceae bacterium]|nr:aminotransferase class I/II-fold pyridoxal phosphate-dependent enzyme [Streptosporangiaceae bacterium]